MVLSSTSEEQTVMESMLIRQNKKLHQIPDL
jgi:hypothetical protein